MTWIKRIGVFLLVLAIAVAGLAWHLGGFVATHVDEAEMGPFTFVYRDAQGNDMREVGAITTALSDLLSSRGLLFRQPLDAFFPDGRAEIGFVVSSATREAAAQFADGARVREIPVTKVMTARFPLRSRLSYLLGALKVDDAFARHRAAHGYAKVEAFALTVGEEIIYFQPITRVP